MERTKALQQKGFLEARSAFIEMKELRLDSFNSTTDLNQVVKVKIPTMPAHGSAETTSGVTIVASEQLASILKEEEEQEKDAHTIMQSIDLDESPSIPKIELVSPEEKVSSFFSWIAFELNFFVSESFSRGKAN